jgi:hypothetical protein
VKICSLYAVGFYYIPGTDMCIKIGGYVRFEAAYNVNGSSTRVTSGDVNNRSTNDLWYRVRGYITADARNQTEYGTVRGYIALGISTDTTADPPQTFNANRAFIQWAGFTFGRAQSFFDFYSQAAVGYLGFAPNSDTGDGGWEVLAYTAQFGNGFSGSLSLEARRTTQIVGQGTFSTPGSADSGSINGASQFGTALGYGGWKAPDIVANLRVDQAWGSASIAGALHQVNANYYRNSQLELSGHPADEWGFAIMAGLRLNTAMIGQGDYLQLQGIYTQGALRYLFQNPNNNWWYQHGAGVAYGVLSDGVYGGSAPSLNGTDVELTTAWGLNASYEHFWNPRWRTSLYGGYADVSYNGQANAILCVLQGFGSGVGTAAVARPGCSNDWTSWWIGSRTQWNVTKDFYLGLDVAYQKLNGMNTPTGVIPAAAIPTSTIATAGTKVTSDEDNWMVRFRVHRDFYP